MKLNVISPLAIRSDHAPGGSETAKVISGSTLLGALASTHRLLCNKQTDEFESLFLTDNIHYPNLYPANFKDQDVENSDNWPVYPVPRTAQTCKRFPGFSYIFPRERKVEPGDRHGVQGFSKVAVEIKAPRPGPRQDEKRSGDVGERRWGCDANPSRRAPRC